MDAPPGIYRVLITDNIVFIQDTFNHSVIVKFPTTPNMYICMKCGRITRTKDSVCRYCSGERKKRAARPMPA